MTANVTVKADASVTEYVPYGGQDKIKLSVQIVKNLIAVPTRSGKTCSDRDALKFIALCQAKRLNPFEGDAFLIGFDTKNGAAFNLITAHQAYLKRAELHPEFDGFNSGIVCRGESGDVNVESEIVPDGMKVVGGWCSVFFKNRKVPTTKRIPLARFQKLVNQQSEYGGPWRDDPAGQITKCAEADALRSSFPTMLGGLYMRDEIESPIGPMLTGGDLETAASKLVDVRTSTLQDSGDEAAEAEAGLAPTKKETAQNQLAKLVIDAGYTFDDLMRWAIESGNLEEPARDRCTNFDELSTKDCERWLRAKTGLLTGLKSAKGAK